MSAQSSKDEIPCSPALGRQTGSMSSSSGSQNMVTLPGDASLSGAGADVPMCGLAKRIARPRLTGNLTFDGKQEGYYQDFVEIVNVLSKPATRHYAQDLRSQLRRLMKQDADDGEADDLFAKFGSINQLDDGWVVMFIMSVTQLTAEDIKRVRKTDLKAHKIILSYLVQYPRTWRLPDSLRSKKICYMVFWERIQHVGVERATSLSAATCISDTGALVPPGFAGFTPVYGEREGMEMAVLVAVKHVSGCEVQVVCKFQPITARATDRNYAFPMFYGFVAVQQSRGATYTSGVYTMGARRGTSPRWPTPQVWRWPWWAILMRSRYYR